MTQKQLIDQFCEFRGKCTTDDVVALNFAYEMLAPRWISIKEELPPKDGRYLFYDEFLGPRVSAYYVECTLVKEITHWMPLLQPPKKGGEL